MMNLFDIDSMYSIATGRREGFLNEARQARIARELGARRQHVPSRFRRAIGMSLIHAGSRLSGIQSDVRRANTAV